MQDPRRKEAKTGTEQGIKERQSEATSKETLSDLEDSEKVSEANPSHPGKQTPIPAPDGQGDKTGGRADGSDTGGPM